jgi:hypothetical protein
MSNTLNDRQLHYIETMLSIKPNVIKYLFDEYPNSYFDDSTNIIYIKGKQVESFTFFILNETELLSIKQLMQLLNELAELNVTSEQTIRNYIYQHKLPTPNIYIGRYGYFDKHFVINFINENF